MRRSLRAAEMMQILGSKTASQGSIQKYVTEAGNVADDEAAHFGERDTQLPPLRGLNRRPRNAPAQSQQHEEIEQWQRNRTTSNPNCKPKAQR